MQNEQLTIVHGPRRTDGTSDVVGMDEMLHMPFDQLWEQGPRDHRMIITPPLSPSGFGSTQPRRASPVFHRPHVDFGAIHALQGTSRPTPFGFGMFDLDPYDSARLQRGVRPDVLQRLRPGTKKAKAEGKVCHICIEEFKLATPTTELPCKHLFCRSCIQEWLKKNDTCPVCRYKFPDNDTYLTSLHD